MKAKDIRPGVVYAYGQGEYTGYDALVIADITLATRNGVSGVVKYPALRVPEKQATPEVIAALEAMCAMTTTVEQAILLAQPTVQLHTIQAAHGNVRGPWKQVIAERDRRHAAIQQRRAAQQAIRDEETAREYERWRETADALAALGVPVVDGGGWEESDYTSFAMDQDTADALIARLRGDTP